MNSTASGVRLHWRPGPLFMGRTVRHSTRVAPLRVPNVHLASTSLHTGGVARPQTPLPIVPVCRDSSSRSSAGTHRSHRGARLKIVVSPVRRGDLGVVLVMPVDVVRDGYFSRATAVKRSYIAQKQEEDGRATSGGRERPE